MQKHLHLSLALAATGLFAAGSAQAIEDDGFHLRLGAISADGESEIRGSTVFDGEEFDFSEGFDYGSGDLAARRGIPLHPQPSAVQHFSYEKDRAPAGAPVP